MARGWNTTFITIGDDSPGRSVGDVISAADEEAEKFCALGWEPIGFQVLPGPIVVMMFKQPLEQWNSRERTEAL